MIGRNSEFPINPDYWYYEQGAINMTVSTTIQIRNKGSLTLPVELRRKYGLSEGRRADAGGSGRRSICAPFRSQRGSTGWGTAWRK